MTETEKFWIDYYHASERVSDLIQSVINAAIEVSKTSQQPSDKKETDK